MLNENKLREAFPNTTVYKDLSLIATFKAASIPAFLRDWILKRKAGADGRISTSETIGLSSLGHIVRSLHHADRMIYPFSEASCITVGLFDTDSGVKRCEHGARSAECLQRAA